MRGPVILIDDVVPATARGLLLDQHDPDLARRLAAPARFAVRSIRGCVAAGVTVDTGDDVAMTAAVVGDREPPALVGLRLTAVPTHQLYVLADHARAAALAGSAEVTEIAVLRAGLAQDLPEAALLLTGVGSAFAATGPALVTALAARLRATVRSVVAQASSHEAVADLADQRLVQRAAGVHAERHGLTPHAAFGVLLRQARAERRKLRDVARDIVDALPPWTASVVLPTPAPTSAASAAPLPVLSVPAAADDEPVPEYLGALLRAGRGSCARCGAPLRLVDDDLDTPPEALLCWPCAHRGYPAG